jgi:uncharacterized protein
VKVSGTYTFDAPQETVWKGLLDPAVLAATMPGCEKLELTGENEYQGILNIKVGPVQGRFQGKVRLDRIVAPTGYTMHVDGQGAPGFVRASATITLAAEGEERTELTYDGDAQVGGRIASVGQRLLDSSAKAVIKQSLEGLNATLQARSAAAAAGEGGEGEEAPAAPAPAAPPSQAKFAANVAKEVAKDLVPKPVRIALLVLLVLILLLAFYLVHC